MRYAPVFFTSEELQLTAVTEGNGFGAVEGYSLQFAQTHLEVCVASFGTVVIFFCCGARAGYEQQAVGVSVVSAGVRVCHRSVVLAIDFPFPALGVLAAGSQLRAASRAQAHGQREENEQRSRNCNLHFR